MLKRSIAKSHCIYIFLKKTVGNKNTLLRHFLTFWDKKYFTIARSKTFDLLTHYGFVLDCNFELIVFNSL